MFPETSFCLNASVSAKKGLAMGRADESRANVWVGRASGAMVHDWWTWQWLRHGTALDAPWWAWVRGSDQRSRAIRKSRVGSIHPAASGTMAAKPKARQGRKKRRIAGTGTRTGCVCVCVCKGPGNGHVMDARKGKKKVR